MDHAERTDLTEQAMTAAFVDDQDKVATLLERIAQGSNPIQMYTVCCAFATLAAHALRVRFAPRGMTPRDMIFLKPTPDDVTPATTFACRFIVAFANRDHLMTKALFMVALEAPDDQFTESVFALILESAAAHTAVCEAHER